MKSFWSHGLLLILGLGIGYIIGGSDFPFNPEEPSVAMAPADPLPEDASCSLSQSEEKDIVETSSQSLKKVSSQTGERSPSPTKENTREEISQDTLVGEFWKVARKNSRRAEEIVQELGQRFPDSKVWHELRTKQIVLTRDYEKARPLIRECLRKFPKSQQCLQDNISAEGSVGTREQHGEAAKKCLGLYPKHPICYHELARYHMQAGRFDQAVKIYRDLAENNGNYGTRLHLSLIHYQLGVALEGNIQKREALTAFDKACQLGADYACQSAERLQQAL